jgi:recombination protein RecA
MLDIIRAENVADRNAPLLFGEYGVDMAKIILRASDNHACMLFDSTGAMISVAEYETKMEKGQEKQTMTQTARLLSDSLRVLVGSGMLSRSANGMSMFFISQLRDNVGARAMRGIPPPDKKTGGRALRFYASTQVEVSKGDVFKADVEREFGPDEKGVPVGQETKIRVRKNKCNRFQGRVATFNLFSEGERPGLDRIGELATLSVLTGVVQKSGSWFTCNGERLHGEDKLKAFLENDSHAFENITELTRLALARMMDNTALPAEELIDETQFEGGEEIDGGTYTE